VLCVSRYADLHRVPDDVCFSLSQLLPVETFAGKLLCHSLKHLQVVNMTCTMYFKEASAIETPIEQKPARCVA
jgi:hypothetical protein